MSERIEGSPFSPPSSTKISRREMLAWSATTLAALSFPLEIAQAFARSTDPAAADGNRALGWERDAEALAALIIPSEPGSPGALEAGVPAFLLEIAQSPLPAYAPALREGFGKILPRISAPLAFHAHPKEEQTALLEGLRAAPKGSPERAFYDVVRDLTLRGWQISEIFFDQRNFTGPYEGSLP